MFGKDLMSAKEFDSWHEDQNTIDLYPSNRDSFKEIYNLLNGFDDLENKYHRSSIEVREKINKIVKSINKNKIEENRMKNILNKIIKETKNEKAICNNKIP